jgi:hypothetical protein
MLIGNIDVKLFCSRCGERLIASIEKTNSGINLMVEPCKQCIDEEYIDLSEITPDDEPPAPTSNEIDE